jgi:CheY-like chemotaxis protein
MPSILIAEDNEDLRKMLAWLLQPRGYETLQAATGQEAIQVAIAAQPNLILLDLNLPDMNGADVDTSWGRRQLEIEVDLDRSRSTIASDKQSDLDDPLSARLG